MRLKQESIEEIKQLLGQQQSEEGKTRKFLMEYLIEEEGKNQEAAKKYVQRQLKDGKTIKDIAEAIKARRTR